MHRIIISSVFMGLSMVGQVPDVNMNEVAYVPMKVIVPGQMRYSQKNIDLKIDSVRKNKGFITQNGKVVLQYDDGKSAFSLQEAAPVMKIRGKKGDFKYVLKDAHHDTLANRVLAHKAGIQDATMPIRVKNDFSSMSYQDFWRYAYKNYLVDLVDVDSKLYLTNPPQSFDEMKDDPVRYFVTIAARKGGNNQPIEESFGADYPLWYKRLAHAKNPGQYPGDTINAQMIENVMSQKLIDNGFTYDPAVDGESGPQFEQKIRQAHAILLQPKNRINGLRLVKNLGHFAEIKDQLKELAELPDALLR